MIGFHIYSSFISMLYPFYFYVLIIIFIAVVNMLIVVVQIYAVTTEVHTHFIPFGISGKTSSLSN